MVNGTLVEAVNATAQAVDPGEAAALFFTVVVPEILLRLGFFFAAPFVYPEMWWLLMHLILTFVLFELYFERHGDESLGWGAALANSIVMVFISMELLRILYGHEGTPFSVGFSVVADLFTYGLNERMFIVVLVILLGAMGLFTAVVNYFHFLPRRVAFIISGHKVVNLMAYFLMVVVWSFVSENPLPVDGLTFIALILFGIFFWFVLWFLNVKIVKWRVGRRRMRFFR